MPAKIFVEQIYAHYSVEKCYLSWDKSRPWTLLFAVILSAQCTDKRVNQVTEVLFSEFSDLESYVARPVEELEQVIRSTGFFRVKAKNIKKCAEQILLEHKGKVPDTMEALTAFAGVGRKTANVILWNIFGKNIGFVVDTHIGRISQRVGLTIEKNTEKIEKELMKKIPQEKWGPLSHMLIQFGRDLCRAPIPKCSECFLNDVCPRIGVKKSK